MGKTHLTFAAHGSLRASALLVIVLLYRLLNISSAAIESSSSSSSDFEHDYSDYQRRSLLPVSRNRNFQTESRVSTSSSQQNSLANKVRNRRDQSKDLKKLIQELEESDYSNYGSWGNFRQKQAVPKKPDQRPQSHVSREDESDSMIYHVDAENNKELDYDDDYFEIQEHDADEDDEEIRYRNAQSDNGGSNLNRLHSTGQDFQVDMRPNTIIQKSIENVPFWDPNRIENDGNQQLSLDLYYSDDNRRQRELYDNWLQYQSWQAVQPAVATTDLALSKLDSTHMLGFRSVLKVTGVVLLCTFLSYNSVSPRSLPLVEYNKAYKDTLLRVFCSLIWPAVILSQLSSSTITIDDVIGKFIQAFSFGYLSVLLTETVAVTGMRLLVMRILEPMAFKFCPAIPAIFLPWKLSENHYFPSHLTLVLFTVLDSCLVSPVVEEALKLIALKTVMGKRASKKSKIVTSADLGPTQFAPKKEHTLKSYVVVMTALSLGLKVADSVRRILLYTHANQKHKMFFALARSFFPVQELCGAMTALAYAKREILGYKLSYFQVLFPSVFLHCMANFRGMKPVYVWKAGRPWDELQLQAWNAIDDATPTEMIGKTALNLLWFGLLARTFYSLLKQYVQLSREYLLKVKERQMAGGPSNSDTGTGTGTSALGPHAANTATHRGFGVDDTRDPTGEDLEPPAPIVPAQNQNQNQSRLGPGSGDSTAPDSRSNGDRYERSGAGRASSYYQQQQRQDYPMQQQSDSVGGRRGYGGNNYNYNSNGDRSDGRYQQPSHPSSDVAVRNTNMDGKSSDFYPNDSYNGFENREGEREDERERESERLAYNDVGRRGRDISGGNSGSLSEGRKKPHPGRSSGDKK